MTEPIKRDELHRLLKASAESAIRLHGVEATIPVVASIILDALAEAAELRKALADAAEECSECEGTRINWRGAACKQCEPWRNALERKPA